MYNSFSEKAVTFNPNKNIVRSEPQILGTSHQNSTPGPKIIVPCNSTSPSHFKQEIGFPAVTQSSVVMQSTCIMG
jgi:hypothetical protein